MNSINNTNGGFLISKIKQIQGRVFERLLVRHGIDQFNGAQGRILFVLWDTDSIPISELSDKTGLAKTTLTSMLDRLESANLIARKFGQADRRKILISLTETARALSGGYDRVSGEMNEIFYSGFSDKEIIEFENNLRRILKNLNESEK